jgi:hypothetical protein
VFDKKPEAMTETAGKPKKTGKLKALERSERPDKK